MYRVILLVLAAEAVAQLPPLCPNYCQAIFSMPMPPTWDLQCDCSSIAKVDGVIEPAVNTATIVKLQENGIYYEPAELYPVRKISYKDQPFYILNPVGSVLRERKKQSNNVINRSGDPKLTKDINTNAHEKKGDSKIVYLNTIKNGSISGFNISEGERIVDGSSINKNNSISDRNFSKCLTILTIFRKYNNMSGNNHWDTAKFNKLDSLTIEDLTKAIEYECIESAINNTDTLNKTIETRPKKRPITDNQRDVHNLKSLKYNTSQTEHNNDYLKPNYSSFYSTDSKSTLTKSSNSNKNNKEKIHRTSENKRNFNLENNKHGSQNYPSEKALRATPIESVENTQSNFTTFHLQRFNNLNSTDLYSSLNKSENSASDNKPNEVILNKNDLQTLTRHNNSSDITLRGRYTVNSKYSTPNSKQDLESGTLMYAVNRGIYNESEIPLKKVITREFVNGTVLSIINGTENLANNGFRVNESDEVTIIHNNIENGEDDGKNYRRYIPRALTPKLRHKIVTKELIGDTNPVLSATLYFLFGQEYIPAKFVQNSKAELSISIDGSTLCTKLNQEIENKSLLLAALCHCMQLNNTCSTQALNLNNFSV